MTQKTLAEQLHQAAPAASRERATFNYTLTPPNGGKVRRGEYQITEEEWLHIVKGLEAIREKTQN